MDYKFYIGLGSVGQEEILSFEPAKLLAKNGDTYPIPIFELFGTRENIKKDLIEIVEKFFEAIEKDQHKI